MPKILDNTSVAYLVKKIKDLITSEINVVMNTKATPTNDGIMSKEDKTKLDGLEKIDTYTKSEIDKLHEFDKEILTQNDGDGKVIGKAGVWRIGSKALREDVNKMTAEYATASFKDESSNIPITLAHIYSNNTESAIGTQSFNGNTEKHSAVLYSNDKSSKVDVLNSMSGDTFYGTIQADEKVIGFYGGKKSLGADYLFQISGGNDYSVFEQKLKTNDNIERRFMSGLQKSDTNDICYIVIEEIKNGKNNQTQITPYRIANSEKGDVLWGNVTVDGNKKTITSQDIWDKCIDLTKESEKHIKNDNLKTINGQSLIGTGDIVIGRGSSNITLSTNDSRVTLTQTTSSGYTNYQLDTTKLGNMNSFFAIDDNLDYDNNVGLFEIEDGDELHFKSSETIDAKVKFDDTPQVIHNVKISQKAGNTLQIEDDGLYSQGGSGGGSASKIDYPIGTVLPKPNNTDHLEGIWEELPTQSKTVTVDGTEYYIRGTHYEVIPLTNCELVTQESGFITGIRVLDFNKQVTWALKCPDFIPYRPKLESNDIFITEFAGGYNQTLYDLWQYLNNTRTVNARIQNTRIPYFTTPTEPIPTKHANYYLCISKFSQQGTNDFIKCTIDPSNQLNINKIVRVG